MAKTAARVSIHALRFLAGLASQVAHLQHFVAEVVDDLHGDLARLRQVERLTRRAIELRPPPLVDLCSQRLLQLLVGAVVCVLAAVEEVGMADEEALAVVVGVDESARDVVGVAGQHGAGARVEHVHPADRHHHLPVLRGQFWVRLTEHRKQVPGTGFLQQLVAHRQVGVHSTGSTASLPSLISLVSSAVCSWTLASNANAHTSSRSHLLPLIASSAAFLMSASPTVPNSGPTLTRTAAPLSVSPSA